MKTLLVGINSKFIHLNLAVRYLKEYCPQSDIECREYTINNNLDAAVADIFSTNADLIGFSCYIWNIEYILKIITTLKKANPKFKILLGGPEVSYEPNEFLHKYEGIDYIIFGEGEETFKEFLYAFENKQELNNIEGLAFRQEGSEIINKERRLITSLDSIEFPYKNELLDIKGKMVYYEASRGCPFNCQYCLSSTIQGVRNFSMDRVKEDLKKLVEAGVSQVKFVDRTFNCSKSRTIEIFKYLIELNPNINFHFEITAELLDDEIIEVLMEAPKGLFQFEIGVQSTNAQTLDIISRKSSFDDLSEVVNKVNRLGNIHLHLDLIAGLPEENYLAFKKSFDEVYGLKPQMLQLGFLKLLRGSGLRKRSDEWDIKYRDYAPYEVVSTKDISFGELLKLKALEDILEKYYNSGRFSKSIEFILKENYKSPFEFYEEFSQYWTDNNPIDKSYSSNSLYTIFLRFYNQKFKNRKTFNEFLMFDYLMNNQNYLLPEGIIRNENDQLRRELFEYLSSEDFKKLVPEYENTPTKEIIKRVHAEIFDFNLLEDDINGQMAVLLFDYGQKSKTFRRPYLYNITRKVNLN